MTNSLELKLRELGRTLADYQVARFWKVPEEWTSTPCDFFGFTAKGRAILIEAKQVALPRLPIGSSPGLAGHQWIALKDASRANCLSLICWARGGSVACLDYDMAVELSKGRKSIPWVLIPPQFIHCFKQTNTLLEPYLAIPVHHVDS